MQSSLKTWRADAARRDRPASSADVPALSAEDRLPELDALRGLAAVAVVLFHVNTKWLPVGWAAVDLFFVLSGFLITTIILRHGRSPGFLPRFYARRGLRVWPIYYLVVLALAATAPWLYRRYDWAGLPYTLTFTQGINAYLNRPSPAFSNYLGHAWTLAIEEQFYLLWPAALLLVGLRRRRVAMLALACVAGSALARSRGMSLALLAGRGDGLALGGLLAALLLGLDPRSPRAARLGRAFGAVAAVSLAVLAWIASRHGLSTTALRSTWPGPIILAMSSLFFGVVGLTVCRTGQPWLAPLRIRPLRQLGAMSYGLYLYHLPILLLSSDIARAFGRRGAPLWRHALALGVCFAVARLSWVHVEQPILRWKDRFAYQPDPAAAADPIRARASHEGADSSRSDVPAGR